MRTAGAWVLLAVALLWLVGPSVSGAADAELPDLTVTELTLNSFSRVQVKIVNLGRAPVKASCVLRMYHDTKLFEDLGITLDLAAQGGSTVIDSNLALGAPGTRTQGLVAVFVDQNKQVAELRENNNRLSKQFPVKFDISEVRMDSVENATVKAGRTLTNPIKVTGTIIKTGGVGVVQYHFVFMNSSIFSRGTVEFKANEWEKKVKGYWEIPKKQTLEPGFYRVGPFILQTDKPKMVDSQNQLTSQLDVEPN